MRVLIIEDNPHKYENTVDYVTDLLPNAEVTWTETASVGLQTLRDTHVDFAIIDMQMPYASGDRIDKKVGIHVLQQLEEGISKNKEVGYCINSSTETTKEVMRINGFEDVFFIHNNSMFDLTDSFSTFFKGE